MQITWNRYICQVQYVWLGLGTEFRSEKIPRNKLGTVSVIPRKKALIPRHSEFRGRASSEARNGTERNGIPRKKLVLRNKTSPWYLYRGRWGELCTNVVKYTFKLGKVLRNSSKITYQNDLSVHQKSSIRLPRFVQSCVLFRGMVRNGIPRICIYFCSTEKSSLTCSVNQLNG
jgi:hypothetical protein